MASTPTPGTLAADPHGTLQSSDADRDATKLLDVLSARMPVGGAIIELDVEPGARRFGTGPAIRGASARWVGAAASAISWNSCTPLTIKGALRHLSPRSRRRWLRAMRASLDSGVTFDELVCVPLGDQRLRWVQCKGRATILGDGRRELTVVLTDITTQRERELRLRRELTRQDQMAEMAGIGTWTVDLETGELTWSDKVFHIHDLEPGETPSIAEAVAFYTPEAAAKVEHQLSLLLRGEAGYDLNLPLITAKGREVWVHAVGEVELGPDGVPAKIVGSFRDVTEARRAEMELRSNEQRLQHAINGASDGLWDWDLTTSSVHYSPRWKEQIGFEDHELENEFSTWSSRVPDEERSVALSSLEDCISGVVDTYRAEFPMLHKDGTWRWFLARAKAVERDDNGRATRIVGTHTDITDQISLQKALVAAKESAEEAARAKSEFLATMSHEIRTPMNGILGLTQILMDSALQEEQSRHLESIFASGTALLGILNSILDLSKSESGKIELELARANPARCAADVIALMDHEIRAKEHLDVRLVVDEDVPEALTTDPGRFRQVLMNLVGNAVKFTASGTVEVKLSTLPAADEQRDLLVAVRDTGIGIDKRLARRLFEPFTQADATTTRRFGGTGLGLSISKNLVHLLGGTIGCRPNQDKGSVFWFELPIVPVETDAHPRRPRANSKAVHGEAPLEGSRILVVEDNPVNQVVARKMLEKLGCHVGLAENGAVAVQLTETEDWDVILMDCQMPVMDGYEAASRIRTREEDAGRTRTPVIAMTANALAGDRERCLEAGMDDHLSKPVMTGILARTLRAHLSKSA